MVVHVVRMAHVKSPELREMISSGAMENKNLRL